MQTNCSRAMRQSILVNELKQVSPSVVDELIPGVMKLSEVQQVLQMLLREDVPVRQLSIIFGNAR